MSLPTILQPQVRIPSRPATRFSTYNVKIESVFDDEIAKRTKIKQKEAGIGPYLINVLVFFIKWAIPGPFFIIFVFSI